VPATPKRARGLRHGEKHPLLEDISGQDAATWVELVALAA